MQNGGGRRSWVRGLKEVHQAYLTKCAASNLKLLLRKIFGMRKPQNMEGMVLGDLSSILGIMTASRLLGDENAMLGFTMIGLVTLAIVAIIAKLDSMGMSLKPENRPSLTGC